MLAIAGVGGEPQETEAGHMLKPSLALLVATCRPRGRGPEPIQDKLGTPAAGQETAARPVAMNGGISPPALSRMPLAAASPGDGGARTALDLTPASDEDQQAAPSAETSAPPGRTEHLRAMTSASRR
jgi:hypothetical protein